MDSHLKETRIDGETVYDGGFLKVARDRVTLPDGKITKREYIRHPGAVVVLALFDDNTVLLERQYRYPLDRVFIEYPAGKIDAGEDHLACAKRELQEETGYTATEWHFLCTIHNAIAYSDELLDIYLARNLTAAHEQYHRRNALNAIARRHARLGFGIELGQPHPRLQPRRSRIELRRHLQARPAPARPEIDQHR